jgi:hypothetical protein
MKKLSRRADVPGKAPVRKMLIWLPPACAAAGGMSVGFGKYLLENRKIKNSISEAERSRGDNSPSSESIHSLSNLAIEEDSCLGDAVYNVLLDEGGSVAGDLQWVALRKIFSEHGIPFREPYIDLKREDLLGIGMNSKAQENAEVKIAVVRWRELRTDAKAPPVPDEAESESTLLTHARKELEIENKFATLEARHEKLPLESAKTGILSGGGLFCAIVLIELIVIARARIRGWKSKGAPTIPSYATRGRKNKADAREERSAGNGDWERARAEEIREDSKASALPKSGVADIEGLGARARERLCQVAGEESAAAIFDVLNGRISGKLLGRISEGDFSGIVGMARKSKKAFEKRGVDVEAIITALASDAMEDSPPPREAKPARRQERQRHPLDYVKRWGWTSGSFHTLLNSYGFDTREGNGSGNFYVQHKGKKLRHEDGRFIMLPRRNSREAIKTGTADQILKACADFLVELEKRKTNYSIDSRL